MAGSQRLSQSDKGLLGLRALVLNGEFAADARLPEIALAARLGISRTPLREAMSRLVDEGLLIRIDAGGYRVVSLTMRDIEDAIELRGVIEGTAARLAAERGISPEKTAEMEDILARLDEAVDGTPDFEHYLQLNTLFHDLLGNLAGSATLVREIDRVARLPLASPSAFLHGQAVIPDFQDSLKVGQQQHQAIFEAIRRREGSRAEALTREHARLARKNLDFVIQKKPDLAKQVPGLMLVAT